MSDFKSKKNAIMEKMDENKFFSLFRPYLDFIGKGKLFSLVYFAMAVINLALPFYIMYLIIDYGFFGLGAKYVFAIIFAWLIICFACWIGFQLWWNRRKKVEVISKTEFVAIPLVSDILQTYGEWLGTLIAVIGVGAGLVTFIFLGNESTYFLSLISFGFFNYSGFMNMVWGIVYGLCTIIVFRVFAELLRVVAALCNNTKEIADNIKKK